jgi:hypothetical protein
MVPWTMEITGNTAVMCILAVHVPVCRTWQWCMDLTSEFANQSPYTFQVVPRIQTRKHTVTVIFMHVGSTVRDSG